MTHGTHATTNPVFSPYADMIKQPHLLIAGATGSGKSVILNGIIYTLLSFPHGFCDIWLCDPKRVEFKKYRKCKAVKHYASDISDINALLKAAVDEMEARYKRIDADLFQVQSRERPIYIIIDEFADLMTQSRESEQCIIRLSQKARASGIHLITATQRPTADIINKRISVNITARVGLRTATAQDSRNIILSKGCEELPKYGYMYYLTPDTVQPELHKAYFYTASAIRDKINEVPKRIFTKAR